MTQKNSKSFSQSPHGSEKKRGTRIDNAPPDLYDPNVPRIGRRESEPHSAESTYIHDVLNTNFPEGRALWDLHHYFTLPKGPLKGKPVDIVFDGSFFKDLNIPHTLSSYKAKEYGGKVPDLAINVLSKSTWRNDLSQNVDVCKDLDVPVYAVFSPYKVTTKRYHPPFLRAYLLQDNGMYKQEELNEITLKEGGSVNEEHLIDIDHGLPFLLGIMERKQEHKGDQPLYRLIFVDPSNLEVLPTQMEKKLREKDEKMKEKDEKLREKDEKLREKDEEIKRLKEQLR